MNMLGNLSLQHKLVLSMVSVASLVSLVSGLVYFANQALLVQTALRQQLSATAGIIGAQSTAALAFRDPETARKTLDALRAQPRVTAAWIFDHQHRVFAEYRRPAAAAPLPSPPAPAAESHRFDWHSRSLYVWAPIAAEQERLGTILVAGDLAPDMIALIRHGLVIPGMLLASGMLAWLLSARLQKPISAPVLHLLDKMKAVSLSGNYGIRAHKSSGDELGSLVDRFNEMLSLIQAKDSALAEADDRLEAKVAERTRVLNRTVEDLRRAKESAEAANRAKGESLIAMGHAIRAPMSGVLGMTELLLATSLSDRRGKFADTIRASGLSLLALGNDRHDFSRIGAGKPAPECNAFDAALRCDAKVLLAEDNPVNQAVARQFLEAYGCRVQVAGNGREALQQLAVHGFDLVLMDCHMPEMDGFETTRAIREQGLVGRTGRRLPVLALTANVTQGIREKCLEAGMDDYIAKPFGRHQLEALLKKWLAGPVTAPLASAPAERDGTAAGAPPPVLDPEVLNSIRSMQRPDGPDILSRAIGLYREHSPAQVRKIEAALAERDGNALRDGAHALKSASANLGALKLTERCATLERLGAENRLDAAGEGLPSFLLEFGRVMEALEKLENSL
jgi:CheY-like chemotaxis protein/HPt (histidine-containing phosphotransfer) domain-containing protein